jgi:hypothetical protein
MCDSMLVMRENPVLMLDTNRFDIELEILKFQLIIFPLHSDNWPADIIKNH